MNTVHTTRCRPAGWWDPVARRGRGVWWSVLGLAFLLVLSACTSGDAGAPASLPDDFAELDEFGGDEVEGLLAGVESAAQNAPSPSDAADQSPLDAANATAAGEQALDADTAAGEQAPAPGDDGASASTERPRSGLADQIEFLGSTLSTPDQDDGPVPVSIDIPGIGVAAAPVTDVGVEPNGDMEIPGASEVGWYRFGPRPGDTGSAVLAAHIAYNGVDGVFRNLTEMRPADVFSVNFSDGSSREFQVMGLRQWSKLEAPLEDLFARDGTPRLVLITCGGNFNRALDSYDDNVVVFAVPTDLPA